jgi:non-ribosomal peptide synthetase component F
MIIEKFEEQVRQYYDRPAIKKGKTELTYGQLNEYADRVARLIIIGATPGVGGDNVQQVALLFEH